MMEPLALAPKPRRELPPKDWALTGSSGRKQNIVRSLWLGEGVLEKLNEKLQARYREIEKREVLCEEYLLEDAEIVVVAYGIAARISRAAVDRAREEGLPVGLIRPITLWPFPSEQIRRAAEQFRIFLTVEMSAGQMLQDVQLAVAGSAPVLFYGRMGGGVPTVDEVLDKIKQAMIHKGAEPLGPWRAGLKA
jgi:2-oxoglutarate ferredoxin oxidoreductase subunit alpha